LHDKYTKKTAVSLKEVRPREADFLLLENQQLRTAGITIRVRLVERFIASS